MLEAQQRVKLSQKTTPKPGWFGWAKNGVVSVFTNKWVLIAGSLAILGGGGYYYQNNFKALYNGKSWSDGYPTEPGPGTNDTNDNSGRGQPALPAPENPSAKDQSNTAGWLSWGWKQVKPDCEGTECVSKAYKYGKKHAPGAYKNTKEFAKGVGSGVTDAATGIYSWAKPWTWFASDPNDGKLSGQQDTETESSTTNDQLMLEHNPELHKKQPELPKPKKKISTGWELTEADERRLDDGIADLINRGLE